MHFSNIRLRPQPDVLDIGPWDFVADYVRAVMRPYILEELRRWGDGAAYNGSLDVDYFRAVAASVNLKMEKRS